VEQVLATLERRQRRVIELTYFEGLTAEEIAKKTGDYPSMKRSSLLQRALDDFERLYIQNELARNRWNRAATARELGISYRGLLYKIDRLRLIPPDAEFSQTA
jgi:DNA-binding NtrC family response regulator